MKKFNTGAIICSVLMIICSCLLSIVSVSALSAEGSELLSDLVSAGSSLGINIDAFVPSAAETTTLNQTSSAQAEDDLANFLENIGFSMNITSVTDMIAYLNSGKSLSDWIYSEYGDTVEIPESVQGMSTTDIILYLLGSVLYPSESSTEKSTSSDYVSLPTETETSAVQSEQIKETETESETSIIIYPSDVTSAALKTGDVNNDGDVTAADARLILRVSANLDVFSAEAFNAADVNSDGVITAKDARSVLRYAAKITTSF